MARKRSVGVLVFAVLCIVHSIFCICWLSYSAWYSFHHRQTLPAAQSTLGGVLIVIPGLLLLCWLVFGFLVGGVGILRLKPWARKLLLCTSVAWFSLLMCLMVFLASRGPSLHSSERLRDLAGWQLSGTIVFGFLLTFSPLNLFYWAVICFLTRPRVKEQFR